MNKKCVKKGINECEEQKNSRWSMCVCSSFFYENVYEWMYKKCVSEYANECV